MDLLSPSIHLNTPNSHERSSISSSTTQNSSPTIHPVETHTQSTTIVPDYHPVTTASRKSTRQHKPPIWLHDYVTTTSTSSCNYPIASVVNYNNISTLYSRVLSSYSIHHEPQSFKEASLDPRWVEAIQLEIAALEEKKTWTVVDLPPNKSPIGCKWIFKIKYKASGEVERFKARLVVKGFSQNEGIDYTDSFSPVAKMVIVRLVIALATSRHSYIYQMDVHNAFLNGDLIEEVYMKLPYGFARQGDCSKVYKLQKSLYGLKQAPRQWNKKLTEALEDMGFKQSHFDY